MFKWILIGSLCVSSITDTVNAISVEMRKYESNINWLIGGGGRWGRVGGAAEKGKRKKEEKREVGGEIYFSIYAGEKAPANPGNLQDSKDISPVLR